MAHIETFTEDYFLELNWHYKNGYCWYYFVYNTCSSSSALRFSIQEV